MQIVIGMESTDESSDEIENSSVILSDSDFWDLWYAAAVGAYALVACSSQGPVLNPPLHLQELSGLQWVQLNLSVRERCFDNFCMYPEAFDQLHRALVDWHGLQSTEEFDSMEALGMVLWACGTSHSQTQMQYRFGKSKGSVSKSLVKC